MATKHSRKPLRFLSTVALGACLLAPASALAGEVKFGAAPLETDDSGKLAAGAKTVTTIPSEPGEELWVAHVWAKIDKGAPGPLYVEFHGDKPGGGTYLTYRHEHAGYEGEKYVSMEIELSGNVGFNKGKSYKVKLIQVSSKGKDLVLGNSKISLEYTQPPEDEEASDSGEEEDDTAAQDEHDSLAGPDDEIGDGPDSGAPPAVAPKDKKGCSVDAAGGGFSGMLIILGLGALGLRRRRDR